MQEFNTGDLVVLRSSGPIMTVVGGRIRTIDDAPIIKAMYYNPATGVFIEQEFDGRCLRNATTSPQSPNGVTR